MIKLYPIKIYFPKENRNCFPHWYSQLSQITKQASSLIHCNILHWLLNRAGIEKAKQKQKQFSNVVPKLHTAVGPSLLGLQTVLSK